MNHIEAIEAGFSDNISLNEIARKIYLSYPTKAFIGNEESEFQILNEISRFFDIPITSVQIAGSAKTGRSFYQQTDFIAGISDLDVAIIEPRLFLKYSEIVFRESKGYSNQSIFPLKNGKRLYSEYGRYLMRGIFRPDLMPTGPERAKIRDFFGKLSVRHSMLFCNINAAIYQSEFFFECKQRSAIKNYFDKKAG